MILPTTTFTFQVRNRGWEKLNKLPRVTQLWNDKARILTLVSLTLNQVCYLFDYKKLNYQCPLEAFTVSIRKDNTYVHRKITQQYKEAQKGRGNTIEGHGSRIESLT